MLKLGRQRLARPPRAPVMRPLLPIATPSLNPPPFPVSPQVAVLHEALMELLAARHLFRAALAAQQERDDAAASAAPAA